MITTIRLPLHSGRRPSSIAAHSAAPHEMPDRTPSVWDTRRAVDIAIDPSNPRVLYAGFWQVRRNPYHFDSGGPGSGMWKSTDGGDHWTDITHNPVLPRGVQGRIGITVSPVNPERGWAIVEASDGGLFRSENGGRTWTRVNEQSILRQRAW